MRVLPLTLLFAAFTLASTFAQSNPPAASAVWQMQDSGTTAGLRGIDSVDGTVAWASGTGGTVMKTLDGGAHWTQCTIPDAAKDGATLDFRGVQAWDATTAIVMASGPGDKSRLYKTTDGCSSWKLILKNRDKDGFWDALYFDRGRSGWLLGDPVKNEFAIFYSENKGRNWRRIGSKGLRVQSGTQEAFAASNSSLIAAYDFPVFGSGGSGGAFSYSRDRTEICVDDCPTNDNFVGSGKDIWTRQRVPLGENSNDSGAFAIGARAMIAGDPIGLQILVAVGGGYTKPNSSSGTAAWSADRDSTWTASTAPPHGFRSAVQWSEALKAWITVGTNGSDISRDDGKTWQPLDDGNWNALSLPFVVGPNGRIARLNPAALLSLPTESYSALDHGPAR